MQCFSNGVFRLPQVSQAVSSEPTDFESTMGQCMTPEETGSHHGCPPIPHFSGKTLLGRNTQRCSHAHSDLSVPSFPSLLLPPLNNPLLYGAGGGILKPICCCRVHGFITSRAGESSTGGEQPRRRPSSDCFQSSFLTDTFSPQDDVAHLK